MSTVTEILEALARDGFTEHLHLSEQGRIEGKVVDCSADELVVEGIHRTEGMSNPDDAAVVMAVSCPNGVRGALTLPYGPDVSGPQADAIRMLNLSDRRT